MWQVRPARPTIASRLVFTHWAPIHPYRPCPPFTVLARLTHLVFLSPFSGAPQLLSPPCGPSQCHIVF